MCVTNTTGRRPLSFSLAQTVLPTTGFPPQQQHQQQQRYPESYSTAPVEKPSPLQFSPSLFSLAQPVVSTESLSSSDANAEKLRPKRRRKPQKPGKTAKNNDRHFVVHEYHDHAFDADDSCDQEDDTYNSNDNTTAAAASTNEEHHRRRRGGVTASFPMKLHEVLDQVVEDGLDHIISWQTHGRCFVIHKPKEFVEWVMPKYFKQTKLTSFQRQLNLYGFTRLTRGKDSGGYYNEHFLKGKPFLCKQLIRIKVKGTRFKAASSPEHEPDFYSLPSVTPNHSDCDAFSTGSLSASISSQASGCAFNYEPLPLQYPSFANNTMYGQMDPSASTMLCQPPMASVPTVIVSSMTSIPPDGGNGVVPAATDGVLDDAVNELFFNQDTEEQDTLADFCSDWDPSFDTEFDISLQNDWQLGLMLEKLMEN